jgi:carbon-monoxide dehydrogenase iron sulfur subunit
MKTVFVNPERCIGCRQCEFRCAVAHSHSHDPAQAIMETPPPRSRIHILAGPAFNTSFPNRCRHCDPAPCVGVCPTGAMTRDRARDVVLADVHKCIACAMCAMVCPFDAISFYARSNGTPVRIVATKCDGCIERIDEGLEPACVEACKAGALVYGELNELIAEGRASEVGAFFAATSATETAPSKIPVNVAGWRAWGESATRVNEETHHGPS